LRVQGIKFGVEGLGVSVESLGFRAYQWPALGVRRVLWKFQQPHQNVGAGCGCTGERLGLKVEGLGFRV